MKFVLFGFWIFFTVNVFGQETLDIEKNRDCELFVEKKEYDRMERIEEIEKLEDQLVTVYIVKGKDNKIKTSYTGVMKNLWRNSTDLSDKAKASVITVETDENGMKSRNLPLTDDKSFRIYRADCL